MPFKKGQSGNPLGRRVGSRDALNRAFINDLCNDWRQHGKGVIEKVRAEEPATYLRVVASLVPKDVNIGKSGDELDHLTDEQLRALDSIIETIGARLDQSPGGSTEHDSVH